MKKLLKDARKTSLVNKKRFRDKVEDIFACRNPRLLWRNLKIMLQVE